jgi:uncharacterized protein
MMLVKIHESYRKVVAICDSELIGKKLEEGPRCLEINEHFFKGEEVDEEKLIQIMQLQARDDATFNIVGKSSINTAIKAQIIEETGVLNIQEVPYALTLL